MGILYNSTQTIYQIWDKLHYTTSRQISYIALSGIVHRQCQTQLPEMLISLAPKTLINVYYNKIRFAALHPNKPQH